MVVSTSPWETIKTVLTQPVEQGFTIEEMKAKFNTTIPRFALTKDMTPVLRDTRLASISSYVMALGTQGAENEAPLAMLQYALDSDTKFFNKGDTALVYIITDENDDASASYLLTQKYKYSKYTNGTLVATTVQGYKLGYYFHTVHIYERVPIYSDGQITGYGETEHPGLSFYTRDDCVLQASKYVAPFRGSCESGMLPPIGTNDLNGQDPVQFCNRQIAFLKNLLIECTAPVSHTNYNLVGGALVSSSATYFLDVIEGLVNPLNPASRAIYQHKLIKSKMDEYFGSKYLISVQANIEGQNCTPGPNQTMDKTISAFGRNFTSSNFYMTSICDTRAINGDALKDISVKFKNILTTKYMVALSVNEQIVGVTMYQGAQRIELVLGADYSITGANFQILKPALETFDKIEVRIKAY